MTATFDRAPAAAALKKPVPNASFLLVGALILGVTLIVPYGMVSLAPTPARLLYPGYALVWAAIVLSRWPTAYPALAVGFCAFAPFLRRIADFHSGFVLTNPILLAPLVVLLPTLPSLFRRILTPGAFLAGPLAIMVACLMYGSAVAMLDGKVIQGIYEPGWWLMPPALATFIMERPEQLAGIRRALVHALIVIMPIVSVYGVLQFVSPQAWDLVWMLNVDNSTFGLPAPYQVRVFSMLNGPGICGVFTAYAMILLAGSGGMLGVLVAIVSLPLLLLTLIRTAWLAVAVGLMSILALAPVQQRLRMVAAFVVAAVVMAAALSSPAVPVALKNVVMDRVDSFTGLGTDKSADDRTNTYASFYDRLSISPLGEGFGANGSSQSAAQKRDLPAIDSGFLEIFLTFGIPVGILYMYSLCALVAAAWRGLRASGGALSAQFAVVCAIISIEPLGLAHVGETGAMQWTAIGLLLTTAAQARRPVQARLRARGRPA